MKRGISLLLALLLMLSPVLLTSCDDRKNTEEMRIGVLAGPTGMGLAQLMNAKKEGYAFSLYSDPSIASTDLIAGNLDLLCLPTNTAADLYQKTNGQIRVPAVNCLGSLYLVAKKGTAITSLSDLNGRKVYASVPSSTTKPILEALFAKAGIDVELEMTADHDSLVAMIAMGSADIAVLPEPKVSAALLQNNGYELKRNLNEDWNRYSERPLVMGCIAVRAKYYEDNKKSVQAFLENYKTSVGVISDPALLESSAQTIVEAGVLPKLPVAKSALSHLYDSIVLLDGQEMKDALIAFYEEIGHDQPKDDFYIITK